PGNLLPKVTDSPPDLGTSGVAKRASPDADTACFEIDRASLLVQMSGALDLLTAERRLNEAGLTLDLNRPLPAGKLSQWLAAGAPGAREHWRDPADQIVAGLEATVDGGPAVTVPPAPRRSVGPDLTSLFVGAGDRFGSIHRAWIRVHRRGAVRPSAAPFAHESDSAPNEGEKALLDAVARALGVR
ncbi:MAG: FAD-binding oxidoreductase, partial [Myxococcota bacterium]|nr:FAD-binding oxidoreductase [Myxococcota bacterium]